MALVDTVPIRDYPREYELDGVYIESALPQGYIGQAVFFRDDPDHFYVVQTWPTDMEPLDRGTLIREALKQRGIFEWGNFPASDE